MVGAQGIDENENDVPGHTSVGPQQGESDDRQGGGAESCQQHESEPPAGHRPDLGAEIRFRHGIAWCRAIRTALRRQGPGAPVYARAQP